MQAAAAQWKGKSAQLRSYLRTHHIPISNNYLSNVSKFVDYKRNKARQVDLEPELMNNLFNRFEKAASRQARRQEPAGKAPLKLLSDENIRRTFKRLDLATKDLHSLHDLKIKFDDEDKKFAEEVADKLYELMKDANPAENRILFEFTCQLPDGTIKTEYLRFNENDVQWLHDVIYNLSLEEEVESSYELGKIVDMYLIKEVRIIDIDQLSDQRAHGKPRVAHAFFRYLIKPGFGSLERYQIYSRIEDIDSTPCFIHSLKMKGVDQKVLNAIAKDMNGIHTITIKGIEHIAKKYSLSIWLRYVYEKGTKSLKMGPSNNSWIELVADEHQHILPYDTDIQFEGKTITTVQLLRLLFKDPKKYLIPLTIEDLMNIEHTDTFNFDDLYDIAPFCYREYTFYGEPNDLQKLYQSIPNLYQVSGSLQTLIQKCVRGLGPRISARQHIREEIVDLDINSAYANAAAHAKIQTGLPKRYSETDLSSMTSGYFLIRINKIRRQRKFSAMQGLELGETFVDLITLKDLIRWHEIDYEIVDGVYWDTEGVSIREFIESIYQKRITDKENSQIYKNILNKELYGKSLMHQRPTKPKVFNNQKDAMDYIVKHFDLCLRAYSISPTQYEVVRYKQWTENYNLAHWGCTILSTARSIINNYIYTLIDNGVEVLYSNIDSLIFRKRDLPTFERLFPNSIGNGLGQFHSDLDDERYTSAQEGIFIGKGCYCLKLDEGVYQYRDISRKIDNSDMWNSYLKVSKP